MSGDPGDAHAAAFQMKEEQDVARYQPTPSEHLYGEEITARQDIHVCSEEVLPRQDLASLWSRSDAVVSTKDIPNRLIRHVMTQVGEGSDDPVISPAGVLSGHPDN
jgi:hypothetical protein